MKLRIERLNSLIESMKTTMEDKVDLVEGFLDVSIKKQRDLLRLQKSKLIADKINQEMEKVNFEQLEKLVDG